jgi:hypothetical protein
MACCKPDPANGVAVIKDDKVSTWLGRLHDGRESGAFTSGAFEFRVNFA